MTTKQQLFEQRAQAGAAYAAAASAYASAWMQLRTLDLVLANNNVGAVAPAVLGGETLTVIPHPDFLPMPECNALTGRLHEAAAQAAAPILASLT